MANAGAGKIAGLPSADAKAFVISAEVHGWGAVRLYTPDIYVGIEVRGKGADEWAEMEFQWGAQTDTAVERSEEHVRKESQRQAQRQQQHL